MTLTTERQQFEEWFNEEMAMPITESNSTAVRLMWKAWRASRELLANREAQPVACDIERIKRHALPAGECPRQSRVVLLSSLQRLFTAPPAPAVPDDTRRMDWLVAHHVTVRKPLRYGSEAMFTAQTITDEEDDYHATKLREQIDAAMLAAAPEGGWQKLF
ncbi:hypothetical protein FOT55_14990 [Serratia bockelmannii]|uniref:hypothetical protein n=1 Tax=Serratia bockelmannii TaxID=2703793 RepID=UPI0011C7F711|nr:hypothetical protein [Serratia bockelmannii]TXE47856.1 hypothetical protein FOT55_14990 [Serratia bockelmannii]